MPIDTEEYTEFPHITADDATENTALSVATAPQATKPSSVYAPQTEGRHMTKHAETLHMTRALEGADEPFDPLCQDLNPAPPAPTRDPTSQRFFSLPKAGKIFGKSDRTMRWWADMGHIRTVKIGRSRFVTEAEIQRLQNGGEG